MRFLVLLLLVSLALVGLHLVLLYGFLPYAALGPALDAANAAAQLAADPFPPRHLAHAAGAYAQLRAGAFAAAAAGLLGLLGLLGLGGGHRALAHEGRRLGRDVRRAGRALGQRLRRQPPAAWAGAGVLLLAVVAVRLYFLLHNPFDADEQVSADYFAAPGAAVTAGFYLLPNNHVLYNLLAGAALRLAPAGHPETLLRAPALGLGLLGLVGSFAGLAHLADRRVAAWVTLVFQLAPMAVEYATVARGYGPQSVCVQAAALATAVLLRGPAGHRLAWAVWVPSCLAGFYFIPTFGYAFGGLGAVLLLAGGPGRQARRWQALLAGAGVAALAALLYLPVGWLSGWALLLANPYVRPLALGTVLARLPHHWQVVAGGLYGSSALALPVLGVLALAPVAVRAWGHPAWRPWAWVAWAGAVAPWPLLLAQRVLPPARTLHYSAWLVGAVAALALASVARRWPARAPALWAVAFALGGAYAGARLVLRFRVLARTQHDERAWRQAADWLAARPPRPVLTTVPGFEVYLAHRAWVQGQPRPRVRYRAAGPEAFGGEFLVLQTRPQALAAPPASARCRAVFCNELLCIYAPGTLPY